MCMKKTLLFSLILICSHLLFAQAPQGLNYQAVAYDASGNPVVNQAIAVRLSILDGSATGTLVYQETQNPTTDNTGLFAIVIGNGTVVSGTFNTINWGNGSKWLKTEIDITNTNNYIAVGTTQFMSVPYALYANTGGLSSPSFTNPDGFRNVTPVIIGDSLNYTVPAGKNLYLPTAMSDVVIDGDTLHCAVGSPYSDSHTFVGASENSVVWLARASKLCFLVNKTVDWKTFDLVGSSFTVPANKQFVIVNFTAFGYLNYQLPLPCNITLNGTPYFLDNLINGILDENMVISSANCSSSTTRIVVNGYLKDK